MQMLCYIGRYQNDYCPLHERQILCYVADRTSFLFYALRYHNLSISNGDCDVVEGRVLLVQKTPLET